MLEIILKLFFLFSFISIMNCKNLKTLIRKSRQPSEPYLSYCVLESSLAMKRPYLIKYNHIFVPRWRPLKEYEQDPQKPQKFSWAYRTRRTPIDGNSGRLLKPEDYTDFEKFVNPKTGIVHFPPYTALPGLYEITMMITPKKEFETELGPTPYTSKCYYVIKELPPLIVMDGGIYNIVPEHEDIVLNATNSIDTNKSPQLNNLLSMTFNWSCTQRKTPNFCKENALPSRPEVIIPSRYVKNGEKFEIILTVTTEHGTSSKTLQEIEVVPEAAVLRIQCRTNCPPVSQTPDVRVSTYFSGSCEKNCEGLKLKQYKWEITRKRNPSEFDFDYNKDTHFGNTGRKFIVFKDVLTPDEYFITLKLTEDAGRQGKTTVVVQYKSAPKLENCKIEPSVGISFKTYFNIICVPSPPTVIYDINYEFYVVSEEGDIVMLSTFQFSKFLLLTLPPSAGRTFMVKAIIEDGPPTYTQLFPKIKSTDKDLLNSTKIIEGIYNGVYQKIAELITSNDTMEKTKGRNLFQAVVNELVISKINTSETNEILQNLASSVVEDIIKSPVVQELVTIVDSLVKLAQEQMLTQADPLLGQFSTSICQMMIAKYAERPNISEELNNLLSDALTKCLENAIRPDYDLLKPIKREISITELPLIPLEASIVENYPNYIDFPENYSRYIDNLNRLTLNIVNTTALAAKMLAKAIYVGAHQARKSGEFSATLVLKNKGINLSKITIQLLDVTLVASHDFDESDHVFDILVSTWSRDLMWWNHPNTRVATSILSIQFWHASCKKRITRFKSPAKVIVKTKKLLHFDVINDRHNITIPADYVNMPDQNLTSYIKIYRIELPKYGILTTELVNISDWNELDVVVTKFRFPSIEDFALNKTITVNDPYVLLINEANYDIWCYLAVLPNKKSIGESLSTVIYYNVTFKTSFCLIWNENQQAWIPNCKPGENTTHELISCECRRFSAIAGYVQNAEYLPQELLITDVQLEIQAFYIVFITVAVTFGIYCLLLLLAAFAKKREIYYLADNNKDHTYEYLIIVRTQNRRNSGTTAKITIKLIGNNNASEPHVLNYPDPKILILQRGSEDVFVLTTAQPLGDNLLIELWSDCSGPNPSWYCKDIVVYDLQTHNQWYFKINTNFKVEHDVIHITVAPLEEGDTTTSFSDKIIVCNKFHTFEFWAGERNFRYTARVTTVLSNILLIYVIILVMHGLPQFEQRDCLDIRQKYTISRSDIFSVLVTSLMSFTVHILIAWIFRFSQIEFTAFKKVYTKTHNVSFCCWTILSILIAISTTILIIFGFWIPLTSSLIWLTCCGMAILFDIIILENSFIIVQNLLCKFKMTISIEKKIGNLVRNIEAQRLALYEQFNTTILRPYLLQFYTPLQRIETMRQKIIVELRKSIYNDLEDLFMYGLYNIILYGVILFNKGTLTIISKVELESIVEGKHSRTLEFSKIRSIYQMYLYINETLIPSMQPLFWYENYTIAEAGMMIDNVNKFVGVARLRQHRMDANICAIAEPMRFLNLSSCWPEFSVAYAETETFGSNWGQYIEEEAKYDRLQSSWQYTSQYESGTLALFGLVSTYGGGGYIAFLGRTLYNSYTNIIYLWEMLWLDRKTRSLIIEFLSYNVNYNVFIAVTLVFEQSASGYITSYAEANVIRMLFVENELELVTMAFFLIFIIWVLLLMLKLVVGIYKNLRTLYKKVWLMIDLTINLMSLASISLFFIRMKMVESYLASLERVRHNEFVNYFSLLMVEDFITLFSGLLICIATVRLWKFLRFGLFFRILERTLAMAALPLVAVTFSFFVILTAFGLSGVLIFGLEFPELSTFIKIVSTLIQLALKPDQFDLSMYLVFYLSYFYFSIYLILMQIILFLFVTVIIMGYTKAQLEFSVLPDSYTVTDYLQERIDYIPKLLNYKCIRMRGGDEEKSLVTSKADEFRYANSLAVQRSSMKSMKFIASCVIRNMRQSSSQRDVLTSYETQMMLGVCNQFILKTYEDDEYEIFFKGHFVGERIKIIDEKRIMKIAEFVEMMLQGKSTKTEPKVVDEEIEEFSKMIKKNMVTITKCAFKLKILLFQLDDIEKSLTSMLNEK